MTLNKQRTSSHILRTQQSRLPANLHHTQRFHQQPMQTSMLNNYQQNITSRRTIRVNMTIKRLRNIIITRRSRQRPNINQTKLPNLRITNRQSHLTRTLLTRTVNILTHQQANQVNTYITRIISTQRQTRIIRSRNRSLLTTTNRQRNHFRPRQQAVISRHNTLLLNTIHIRMTRNPLFTQKSLNRQRIQRRRILPMRRTSTSRTQIINQQTIHSRMNQAAINHSPFNRRLRHKNHHTTHIHTNNNQQTQRLSLLRTSSTQYTRRLTSMTQVLLRLTININSIRNLIQIQAHQIITTIRRIRRIMNHSLRLINNNQKRQT